MKRILERLGKPAPEKEQAASKEWEEKAEEAVESAEETTEATEKTEDSDKLKQDINELLELFPKLKANAVPDEVWDRVREGDSLCAAYCLWVVKNAKEQLRIRDVNDKRSHAAPPPVADKGEGEEFFTRDTVKNMSPQQVRKNFKAILNSMDRWK